MQALLFNILLVLCLALAGCSAKQGDKSASARGADEDDQPLVSDALLAKAPPIPVPQLPPNMAADAAADAAEAAEDGKPAKIRYFVDVTAPGAPELAASFAKISLLERLAPQPPDSMTALEQRLYVSLGEGRDILKSYGYYEGDISGNVGAGPWRGDEGETHATAADQSDVSGKDGRVGKTPVHIVFEPGPQYTVGRTAISAVNPPRAAEGKENALPATLADVGLPLGSPAIADNILAAVDRARDAFRNRGYPFAAVDATRYVLDREKRQVEADVRITEGEYVRMGDIQANADSSVTMNYLKALRTWEPGAPWKQDDIENYQENLRQTGLFRSIKITPADKTDEKGRRDVLAELAPAPQRTISAEVKYDSDFGIGAQAGWEHRNLSGHGDNLSVSAPVWQDMQELTAKYRLPYFMRNDQTFLAQGGLLHEKTKAYEIYSAAASSGLEKRFSPRWVGSARLSAESGSLKDPGESRKDYSLFGIPLALAYDNTGSLLNAVKGVRATAGITPYAGKYGKDFSTVRSRFDVYAFMPLVGEDKLVAAVRGTYGAMLGGNGLEAQNVPPSVRFYSGGGGSVRGYPYQSLGPRNSGDDPLGGTSMLEMSGEARWKITEEWGMVAFMDGGMAYDDDRRLGQDLRWGAGLGLRYYTAIGPVRLDVATPLNPRKDDPSVQVYISIGQSF